MRICPSCQAPYTDASQFCPRDGYALAEASGEGGEDERLGTVLAGQFELVERCGEGAMGTVYRARQAGMERHVAVKILRRELVRDAKIVARFDREARAVARLQHPNIVTFFSVGATANGVPFLAMEYVEGRSLAEVLDEAPFLDATRALRIARQVCSALGEAHAEGIVHRDLKPENILLAQKRRLPDFVKVLDFGIAKVLHGEDTAGELESRLTRTGTIFGTPHYIAPEQAAGGDVDGRADLYSLGVILYRCLTGRLPFEGSGVAVMLAHMGQAPPAPRELAPELDPQIEAMILRAMAKDPAQRFQSAEDMADALEALGATLRGPETSAPRSMVAAGTAPVPALAAPLGVVAQVATSEPHAEPGASTAADEAADEADRPPRRRAGWVALGIAIGVGGMAAAGMQLWSRGAGTTPRPPEAPPDTSATPAPALASRGPDSVAALAAVAVIEAGVRPGYRVVTVGESGFAVRAQVPADARVGQGYELIFDVVDPDGTTTDDPELPATIEEPGRKGDKDKTVVAIPQIGSSGRYVLPRTFTVPGRYHVHLYPIPDEPKVHIWFDILVKDENGRLPPEPVPVKVAHAAAKPADRSALPPIFAEAAQAPAAKPAPEETPPASPTPAATRAEPPHEGVADSDPYHILDDRAPPAQLRPAPPQLRPPYMKYRVIRRLRPRPVPRPAPNPDGLE